MLRFDCEHQLEGGREGGRRVNKLEIRSTVPTSLDTFARMLFTVSKSMFCPLTVNTVSPTYIHITSLLYKQTFCDTQTNPDAVVVLGQQVIPGQSP